MKLYIFVNIVSIGKTLMSLTKKLVGHAAAVWFEKAWAVAAFWYSSGAGGQGDNSGAEASNN